MKQKSAKSKEWEKTRRDKLNVTFETLGKLLPEYDSSKPFSKIEILQRSILLLEKLQKKNKDLLIKTLPASYEEYYEELETTIKSLRTRNDQLVEVLRKAEVPIPEYNAKNTWIRNVDLDNKIAEITATQENDCNEINLKEFGRPKKYSNKLTEEEAEKIKELVEDSKKVKKKIQTELNKKVEEIIETPTIITSTTTALSTPPTITTSTISSASLTNQTSLNEAVTTTLAKTTTTLTAPTMTTGIFLQQGNLLQIVTKSNNNSGTGINKHKPIYMKPRPKIIDGKIQIVRLKPRRIKETKLIRKSGKILTNRILIQKSKKKRKIVEKTVEPPMKIQKLDEKKVDSEIPKEILSVKDSIVTTKEIQTDKSEQLNTSDLSNDIFANLQVPVSGSNSESLSPTAAYLLTFPLVSSKLPEEEGNNESQSSPSILQIPGISGNEEVRNENQKENLLLEENFSTLFSPTDENLYSLEKKNDELERKETKKVHMEVSKSEPITYPVESTEKLNFCPTFLMPSSTTSSFLIPQSTASSRIQNNSIPLNQIRPRNDLYLPGNNFQQDSGHYDILEARNSFKTSAYEVPSSISKMEIPSITSNSFKTSSYEMPPNSCKIEMPGVTRSSYKTTSYEIPSSTPKIEMSPIFTFSLTSSTNTSTPSFAMSSSCNSSPMSLAVAGTGKNNPFMPTSSYDLNIPVSNFLTKTGFSTNSGIDCQIPKSLNHNGNSTKTVSSTNYLFQDNKPKNRANYPVITHDPYTSSMESKSKYSCPVSFTFSLTNPTTTIPKFTTDSHPISSSSSSIVSHPTISTSSSTPSNYYNKSPPKTNFPFSFPPVTAITTTTAITSSNNFTNYNPFSIETNHHHHQIGDSSSQLKTNFTFSLTSKSDNQKPKYTTAITSIPSSTTTSSSTLTSSTLTATNYNAFNTATYPSFDQNFIGLAETTTPIESHFIQDYTKSINSVKTNPLSSSKIGIAQKISPPKTTQNSKYHVNWMANSDFSMLPPLDFTQTAIPTTTTMTLSSSTSSSYYPPPITSIKSDIFFAHGDDNNFPWSPSKMSNILDGSHLTSNYIPSTLPTLSGDLALSTPCGFPNFDANVVTMKSTIMTEDLIKKKEQNYQNQNFFSVSQLVEPSQSIISNTNNKSDICSGRINSSTGNKLIPKTKQKLKFEESKRNTGKITTTSSTTSSSWNYSETPMNFNINNSNETQQQKQSSCNIYSAEALISTRKDKNRNYNLSSTTTDSFHNIPLLQETSVNNNYFPMELNNDTTNYNSSFLYNPTSSANFITQNTTTTIPENNYLGTTYSASSTIIDNNNSGNYPSTKQTTKFQQQLQQSQQNNIFSTINSNKAQQQLIQHQQSQQQQQIHQQHTQHQQTQQHQPQNQRLNAKRPHKPPDIYSIPPPTSSISHHPHLSHHLPPHHHLPPPPPPPSHHHHHNHHLSSNITNYDSTIGIGTTSSFFQVPIDDTSFHLPHLNYSSSSLKSSYHPHQQQHLHQQQQQQQQQQDVNHQLSPSTGTGTNTLTNFNLSAICPEINEKVRQQNW